MKKIMLALLFMLGMISVGRAGMNVDLNPFWIHTSTINMSSTAKQLTVGGGLVLGIVHSTATCNTYVEFRDTDTANTSSAILARTYNVAGSTGANIALSGYSNSSDGCNGVYEFGPPIRFYNGLSANASAATTNNISVIWYQNPSQYRQWTP